MTPEKLFHELLGLGLNWKVEECEFKREEGVVCLRIRETEHLWEIERCPESGGRVKCYDHVEEMVWRHLNVFEHKCEIRCRLPRGRCESNGKVYRVKPPWEGLSKHFTKAFEAMALLGPGRIWGFWDSRKKLGGVFLEESPPPFLEPGLER
ncbi:MAG: hypothetical protein WCH57_03050, partial [Verrucomicrobiota bacterium]